MTLADHLARRRRSVASTPALHAVAAPRTLETEAIERFPYAVMVLDADGQVLYRNVEAARLIASTDLRAAERVSCCALLGCQRGDGVLANVCLSDLAISQGAPLPEVRVDLATGGGRKSLWVTAAPLGGDSSRVLLQLRPGSIEDRRRRTDPHWMSGPRLRITTLGGTGVQSVEGPICGEWLDLLPGQLLRYLVVTRRRMVTADEIGEALWPEADYAIAPKVRYHIHALRRAIEPERGARVPSSLIISRAGRYRLNPERVGIDADEFESQVRAALARARDARDSADQLQSALSLYRGDFLSDVPYADWAMAERDHLHSLACTGLRTLADLSLARRELDDATRYLERLSSLQPYDEPLHRQLIQLDMQRGHQSNAVRRYETLHARMTRTFGKGPEFTPADLAVARQ
jgi:DNA-binding SARP family transcriptional activator